MSLLDPCRSGTHPWRELSRTNQGYDVERVVRWCPTCGSVVIDAEIDNRTDPGHYLKLTAPEAAKRFPV